MLVELTSNSIIDSSLALALGRAGIAVAVVWDNMVGAASF